MQLGWLPWAAGGASLPARVGPLPCCSPPQSSRQECRLFCLVQAPFLSLLSPHTTGGSMHACARSVSRSDPPPTLLLCPCPPVGRCERASAYVKSLGPSFQDVVQLKGEWLTILCCCWCCCCCKQLGWLWCS